MSDSYKSSPEKIAAADSQSELNAAECSAEADWFDSHSSRKQSAVVYFCGETIRATTADGERRDGDFNTVKISSRLGNVPRTLTFVDGVVLSVHDNDLIDRMLAKQNGGAKISLLHYFESRWRHIFIFLIATALFLSAASVYGIPAAADFTARHIPADKLTTLGDTVYAQLRKQKFIRESKLPSADIARAQKLFSQITVNYDNNTHYQLHTHDVVFGATSIANAFALPGGKIIITDKLINLLEDDEITAILAHEIGHIELRHGMRAILGAAGVLAFFTFIGGDISWIISGGAALLNLQYSRDYEREADCFAYHYLRQRDLSPALLGQSLHKMEQDFSANAEIKSDSDFNIDLDITADSDSTDSTDSTDSDSSTDSDITNLSDDAAVFWQTVTKALSTHPKTEERQNLSAACQEN